MWIESYRDYNGRHYVAWRPHISRWFNDRKTLLKWLGWPVKTETGDALRAWLDELEARPERGVKQDAQATATLDPSDPNYQTKTVI